MEAAAHFRREVRAFHDAARRVTGDAPLIPSCPDWSMSDLIVHLSAVQRGVSIIIRDKLDGFPDPAMVASSDLPADREGWPAFGKTPNLGPIPRTLLDWFMEGAERLGRLLTENPPDTPAWTWSTEQTVGFWLRMQVIETAVHRWDAENAIGAARPIREEIAGDAITQTFEVMAPMRRAWRQAPAGAGERYRFCRTDGPGEWVVRFDGEHVRLEDGEADIELAGTASDLMLFLWQRIPAGALEVRGDQALIERYFVLVHPI